MRKPMNALEAIEEVAKEQGMAPEEVLGTLIRELTIAYDRVTEAQENRSEL
jgi:hypothetical protein